MSDILESPRDRTIRIVLGFGIVTVVFVLLLAFLGPRLTYGELAGDIRVRTPGRPVVVTFAATSRPQWRWARRNVNYRYEQLTLAVHDPNDEGVQTWRAEVDLLAQTWQGEDGQTGAVDDGSLRDVIQSLVTIPDIEADYGHYVQGILNDMCDLSVEMGGSRSTYNGTIIASFNYGNSEVPVVSGIILVWWLAWPAYLLLAKQPAARRWFTGSRKAFVITIPIVLAIHLVFADLVSPGTMPGLGPPNGVILVTSVSYYMVGSPWHLSDASWWLMVFNALTWASIVSWTAMLITTVRSPKRAVR
jgi:hypothetical protein